MATFSDLNTEIQTQTRRNDKSAVIYEYLYWAVKNILGAREDWDDLRAREEISVVDGTYDYTVTGPIHRREYMEIEQTDEWAEVFYLEETDFRREYGWDIIASSPSKDRPRHYTFLNDTTVRFGPIPNDSYTARLLFFQKQAYTQGSEVLISDTELVKTGAKFKLYLDMGQRVRASDYRADFEQGKLDYYSNQSDPDNIVIMDGYYRYRGGHYGYRGYYR